MKKSLAVMIIITMLLSFVATEKPKALENASVSWTVYKYASAESTERSVDAGDTYEGKKRYFVAYGNGGMNLVRKNETTSLSSAVAYAASRIAEIDFTLPKLDDDERVYLKITGYNRTRFNSGKGWTRLVVLDSVMTGYDKTRILYDESTKYYGSEVGEKNANPVKRVSKIDITPFVKEGKRRVYLTAPSSGIYIENIEIETESRIDVKRFYNKESYVRSYNEIAKRSVDASDRAWRDGMLSGNGEEGYITSGEPYSDTFIFQYMFFNYPTEHPRYVPPELTGQLEDARLNVFNMNSKWIITDADGNKRTRTRAYVYHPGHQLRLTSNYTDVPKDYVRWTNYETAETGVYYKDKYGEWERVSFTSRTDKVSVTKTEKSSEGELINMTVSIDDVSEMCKAYGDVTKMRYKKIVGDNGEYIAMVAHYPSYEGSELCDGGYVGMTYIIVEGENASKRKVVMQSDDAMLVGEGYGIEIENAEAVYFISTCGRTHSMTGQGSDWLDTFSKMTEFETLNTLLEKTAAVANKYTFDGKFDYTAALEPSAKMQKEEFDRVSFDLDGDEEFKDCDNGEIIDEQKKNADEINHEFMERTYAQARYAMICCSGVSAPRLCGMWLGEWNPTWNAFYTVDANVNLQVSGMNTGNMTYMQEGYITFFLRHCPDFMNNAAVSYGMHDALQLPHNIDADRAMLVQYDNSYPFEYWNAGVSWCLLPIYEYWQCYGNRRIPINDYMRIGDLKTVLSVNDGGLTDEEYDEIIQRGWLDLEKDILLPLLTKQANFWEQIVTPRYYIDVNGKACHDENKTELAEGETYMIIPAYSPENKPKGYGSTLTANATMDIAAARDGLDMVCEIEKTVMRDGWEDAVEKWQKLKNDITSYKYDSDGALKEWAMSEYTENNNHRHLSHLYVAWPAHETKNSEKVEKGASIALNNREKYNTGDATTGHGWIHTALVQARLKRGEDIEASLLKMMSKNTYYNSLMTDHDSDNHNDSYCSDTAFGSVGVVNEALVYSDTGEIEVLPARPSKWGKGKIAGLMARSRAEISSLEWDVQSGTAKVCITSVDDENSIRLSCGEVWSKAEKDGEETKIEKDERGKYIELLLNENESTSVTFYLAKPEEYIQVTLDGKEGSDFSVKRGTYRLEIKSENEGDEAVAWKSSATGIGVVKDDGELNVYSPGSFTVTAVTSGGYEISANINAEENSIYTLKKAEVANVKASDEGFNSSWVPENAVDGKVTTAYSSKDNKTAKYIMFELEKAEKIDCICVIGRYTQKDGDGVYAKRINGARIYASNEKISDLSVLGTETAPLVGKVENVTATGEFVPAETVLDMRGEYKYYILYSDIVNNGANVSMAISEISFYTKEAKVKAEIVKQEKDAVTVRIESEIGGTYNLTAAFYDNDNSMINAEKKRVVLIENKCEDFDFGIDGKCETAALFLWNGEMVPIMKKTQLK